METTKVETEQGKVGRTCRCGHTRGHHMVNAEAQYTPIGWLMVALGISAKPLRVRYRCRRCDQVFDQTTDPKVLREHY
jgi:hypothetical protein